MGGKKDRQWRQDTVLVRGGTQRSSFDETSEGLFMTSGYVYATAEEAEESFTGKRDRFVYSRYGNPTIAMFQDRLALLEGAKHCHATASGMAAVFATLVCGLKAGDRVVASRALFGASHHILTEQLPRFGIKTELVDGTKLGQWETALSEKADMVLLETPSNPLLEIIDIRAVCKLAHAAGALVAIDNVFATPILQKPLELGADVVVYSTTKHIDGQGRAMGGAVLTNDTAFFEDALMPFVRNTGPCISPFNAWLMLKGLETLDIRVQRHCANARSVANFLAGCKGVNRVIYPGMAAHPQHDLARAQMSDGGNLVSFDVNGGREAAFKFLNALELIDIANNLGDAKSLITHPATTTHQKIGPEERAKVGIGDGLVRLSVGLEDVEDIKEDLRRALAAALQ